MIKIVISKGHGGFCFSPLALLKLVEKKSVFIKERTCDEFGLDFEDLYNIEYGDNKVADDFYCFEHYALVNIKQNKVYTIESFVESIMSGRSERSYLEFRSHPDIVGLVEEMGDAASGPYQKLKIVTIEDEDITLDDIVISDYDNSEFIEEKCRKWF